MSDIVENEALRAKLAEDEANINLKADFIEKTINDSAALDQRVKELEKELRTVLNLLEANCRHKSRDHTAEGRRVLAIRQALK